MNEFLCLSEAEQWYTLGCRRFPTATMFLLRAQFYFFYLPTNKVIGLSALTKSEDREPAFVSLINIFDQ